MEDTRQYDSLLNAWGQNGILPASGAQNLQKYSGLPKEALRYIWETCAHGKNYLSRDEFFSAMNLVKRAQRGENISTSQAMPNKISPQTYKQSPVQFKLSNFCSI
ncbi:MAG: hypothetical protein EZS28_026941 [Streblomastix strix]|uniref:EH domain-containing protein n=1 Tax=Streblomastix strix TaxID=222440 RepID=A0A5J4V594_9EUKA|nr:MAG: hypothetical protein EZS28_026941 [Streblomastix strix]